jgi:hypothetical protein
MNNLWTLKEAHVDWLTATAGTGPQATALLDFGGTLLSYEREKGNYGRPSNFEGYHGTVTANLFVGWRLDGACIRLGGPMARDWWRDVARQSSNVTRIDLACTALRSPPDPDVAIQYWNGLPTQRVGAGRPTDYTCIQARLGGQTLYCGSRSSERFGRIYDKFRESKGEYKDGSWRFEVEYKRQAAKEVATYLLGHADIDARIAGIVERRYLAWGIVTPWSAVEYSWRETYQPPKTDNESRMKWLRDQVRLSIEKVSASATADEIRLALGLQFGRDEANLAYEEVMKRRTSTGVSRRQDAVLKGFKEALADDRDRSQPDDGPNGAGSGLESARADVHAPTNDAGGNRKDEWGEVHVPVTILDGSGNEVTVEVVSDG